MQETKVRLLKNTLEITTIFNFEVKKKIIINMIIINLLKYKLRNKSKYILYPFPLTYIAFPEAFPIIKKNKNK